MSAECEFIQQVEGAFHYPKEQDYFDILAAEYALNLAFSSCFDAEIDFRCEDVRAAWEEKDTIVTTGG